jgi:hypothetical protein
MEKLLALLSAMVSSPSNRIKAVVKHSIKLFPFSALCPRRNGAFFSNRYLPIGEKTDDIGLCETFL